MSTKECPSCGAQVPASANRCKECFHDFEEAPASKTPWLGPMILLGSVAAMAVAAAGVLWYIQTQPVDIHAIVDSETRSIVWTTKYRDHIETDRVMFDQVAKVEHSAHGDTFQLVAVTTGGDRKVITEANHNLDSDGRRYAQMIGKPYEDVDPAAELDRKR